MGEASGPRKSVPGAGESRPPMAELKVANASRKPLPAGGLTPPSLQATPFLEKLLNQRQNG